MRKLNIFKFIALLGLGFSLSIFLSRIKNKSGIKYLSISNISDYANNDVKNFVARVYKNIFKRNIDNSTLVSWTNKLLTKQVTVYNFLISCTLSKINSVNISTLIQSLYLGIIGRAPSISESSKLVSVFNSELRKYGSKERALKGMLTYFVKMSSIVSYCNKLGLKLI